MDPIDFMCRFLKNLRDNGHSKLAGMSDGDLVDLAWKMYENSERKRKERDNEPSAGH